MQRFNYLSLSILLVISLTGLLSACKKDESPVQHCQSDHASISVVHFGAEDFQRVDAVSFKAGTAFAVPSSTYGFNFNPNYAIRPDTIGVAGPISAGYDYRIKIMPANRVFDVTEVTYRDTMRIVSGDNAGYFYCPLESYKVDSIAVRNVGTANLSIYSGGIYLIK